MHEELGDAVEVARWRTRAANAERVLDEFDGEQDSMTIEIEAEEESEPANPEPDATPDEDRA